MNGQTFLSPFKLILSAALFVILFQTAFSQENPIEKNSNFYSLNDNSEKIFAATRTRVFKTEISQGVKKELKTENSAATTSTKVNELENRVFALVNERRVEAGLPALVWNNAAAKMARIHSENMANFKFFSHTGQDGKKVNERANALGLKEWHQIGENIAFNRGFKSPLESAVQSWMNSAGHRENILKSNWQDSGIGVAVTADGTYYFTQVFLQK